MNTKNDKSTHEIIEELINNDDGEKPEKQATASLADAAPAKADDKKTDQAVVAKLGATIEDLKG
jgi:hypothetical protein